jgi:hypothetical protein
MVKSVPMRDHSVVIKPRRRRAGAGILLMLVLVVAFAGTLFGFGFLSPAKLAFAQEQTLSLLHGGIFDREERTFIDACVEGAEGSQAVTRTIRTITFNDGTTLSVIFSTSPSPTTADCGGGGG